MFALSPDKPPLTVDLQGRVDWVMKHRQHLAPDGRRWTLGAWSELAGLRRTHLNTILVREATEPESRQEVRTMARLARAAGVSVCWLTFGIGKPEEFDEPTSPLIAARMMAHMMGYQASFLDDWLPPSASDFDAETLWTLIKADYQRWLISQSATERPRSKL